MHGNPVNLHPVPRSKVGNQPGNFVLRVVHVIDYQNAGRVFQKPHGFFQILSRIFGSVVTVNEDQVELVVQRRQHVLRIPGNEQSLVAKAFEVVLRYRRAAPASATALGTPIVNQHSEYDFRGTQNGQSGGSVLDAHFEVMQVFAQQTIYQLP
jgi:hypothetical protein